KEPETAGERAHDRAERVERVGETDLLSYVVPPPAEERDEKRKLHARDESRGQHHEQRDGCPPDEQTGKSEDAERAQKERPNGDATAERIGQRDEQRFDETSRRESGQRRAPIGSEERIERASEPDAEQRDGEDEAEGEDRAPEDGAEHAVPHHLHQEEGETDD